MNLGRLRLGRFWRVGYAAIGADQDSPEEENGSPLLSWLGHWSPPREHPKAWCGGGSGHASLQHVRDSELKALEKQQVQEGFSAFSSHHPPST